MNGNIGWAVKKKEKKKNGNSISNAPIWKFLALTEAEMQDIVSIILIYIVFILLKYMSKIKKKGKSWNLLFWYILGIDLYVFFWADTDY